MTIGRPFDYIVGPGAGLGTDADPRAIEAVASLHARGGEPFGCACLRSDERPDRYAPILPSIQARTLVMNRIGDPCARVEAARDMASRIPGAKFKEYPGNSHFADARRHGSHPLRHPGIHHRRTADRFLRSRLGDGAVSRHRFLH